MTVRIHKERRMLEAAIEKTRAGKLVWLVDSSFPRDFFASAWLNIKVQVAFKMEHTWWDLGSPRYEFLLWGLGKEPEIIKGRDGLFLELYLAIREQVDAKQAMMKRETWDALVGEEKEG